MNAFLVFNEIFSTRNWSNCQESSSKIVLLLPESLFSMHESSSACRVSHETQTWIRFQKTTHHRNVNVEEKIIL